MKNFNWNAEAEFKQKIAELEADKKRMHDLIGDAWESGWKAGRDEEDAKSFEEFIRANGLEEL